MKELDFRAWVYYGEELEKPHYSQDWESLSRFFEDHDENDDNQCIEEFTGKKDETGRKIYVGDIVRYGGGNAYEVCFLNGCFGIKNRNLSVLYNSYTFNDNDIYGSNGKLRLEVIGNIHKNPELLEEK